MEKMVDMSMKTKGFLLQKLYEVTGSGRKKFLMLAKVLWRRHTRSLEVLSVKRGSLTRIDSLSLENPRLSRRRGWSITGEFEYEVPGLNS